jgi:hypothetical protein
VTVQRGIESHFPRRSPEIDVILAPREKLDAAHRGYENRRISHRERAVRRFLNGLNLEIAADGIRRRTSSKRAPSPRELEADFPKARAADLARYKTGASAEAAARMAIGDQFIDDDGAEMDDPGRCDPAECPNCDNEALVDAGPTGDNQSERWVCYACGFTWADGDLETCDDCQELCEPEKRAENIVTTSPDATSRR